MSDEGSDYYFSDSSESAVNILKLFVLLPTSLVDYLFILPGTNRQEISATVRILHGCKMRIRGSAQGTLFWHREALPSNAER